MNRDLKRLAVKLGIDPAGIEAIAAGTHREAFSILGMHLLGDGSRLTLRVFFPDATAVEVLDRTTGKPVAQLKRLHASGFFAGFLGRRRRPFAYQLRIVLADLALELEDPYRFPPRLEPPLLEAFQRGDDLTPYHHMGAHLTEREGVDGVTFVLWAPNARRVSIVGDFNNWDGRRHLMAGNREHWELFIPGLQEGDTYMYEIVDPNGACLPLKADPFARATCLPPETGSRVFRSRHHWQDEAWVKNRAAKQSPQQPISIYECHLGSWKRNAEGGFLTYRELAEQLVPYVADMGFTHLQILPIAECPFYGSWGYQPVSLYAPSSRYGSPDDLKYLIDACHQQGLGVLLDWVPAHFPADGHGLGFFDGTHLYEHADPRKGLHPDWGTLIYNHGRGPVRGFLLANAHFWLQEFHIDGLRVDAVASMIYLDYSRQPGEWLPNQEGDNRNLESIAFLKELNDRIDASFPDIVTIAEESTAWPGVTRATQEGGMGFSYKWNLGWMNDSLAYMKNDPLFRKHHHDKITFGLVYAHDERFILPLSHDEVVHLKRSLLGRMPGGDWQRFANLRAYYGFMWTHPGKKLLFMGGEIGQEREWDHDTSLDWHLLDSQAHCGIQALVRDLNHLYLNTPALHHQDCDPEGFCWVRVDAHEESFFAFLRLAKWAAPVLVVCNFTPVVRQEIRFGVPKAGFWAELLNTDHARYGGSDVHHGEGKPSEAIPWDEQAQSLALTLPPLATVVMQWRAAK